MAGISTKLWRGVLWGVPVAGIAFIIVLLGHFPPRVHAWFLLSAAAYFAITDAHFKSLLSELGALLRRGTYSVWQLEQLNQTVPLIRKEVSFVWAVSTWLKAVVGLASALLLWDGLPWKYQMLAMFSGYAFLLYSIVLGVWARQNYRRLEREVDSLTMKEVELKEKRRLLQGIEAGVRHDFGSDKLAEDYTKPPIPL
ncbi:MAG TPA: hypothetical protein VH595_22735 [Verrucomicrobiae bacterium]|jgi:hypothetical protein|nr:hypothetical protein [Verrucomicrobiae bacterium]